MSLWSKVKGVFGRLGRDALNIVSRAGLPLGAAIGSFIPGVGTALGASIGGALQGISNKLT